MKHSFLLTAVAALGLIASPLNAQSARNGADRSLFSDQKAAVVGDVLTVLVLETSSASNDSRTSATRKSGLSFSAGGAVGSKPLPDASLSIGSTNEFNGEGGTASSGSVRAKISARIDSVSPNGSFFISGSRTISINGEDQIIRIAGLVRPVDILADNSVYSSNIADAAIVFQGNGLVEQAQSPGLLTRLFHWIF